MDQETNAALPRVTFVFGGASSGKSLFAEQLLHRYAGRRIYLASAEAHDHEMRRKIAEHQARRGPDWKLIEAPLDIAGALLTHSQERTGLLVDCLTLWISNLFIARRNLDDEFRRLMAALATCKGSIVLVSNETGLGIVPENEMARRFRENAGRLNQLVAAAADQVFFVAAGIPLRMK